jgi:hypothetical protein
MQPDIHRLITDLAIYEKEPDAVEATHESLRETIFEHKYANVIIARTAEGEAVGMALVRVDPCLFRSFCFVCVGMSGEGVRADWQYFFNYSTWQGKPGLYVSIDLHALTCHSVREARIAMESS